MGMDLIKTLMLIELLRGMKGKIGQRKSTWGMILREEKKSDKLRRYKY